ncbi:MAG: sensor histidine kinase, partial [Planctomycetota bacterium]
EAVPLALGAQAVALLAAAALLGGELCRLRRRLREDSAVLGACRQEARRASDEGTQARALLHDLRNVLGSAKLSVGQCQQTVDQSRLPTLRKALEVLEEELAGPGASERARKATALSLGAAECLARDQERLVGELRDAVACLAHMQSVLDGRSLATTAGGVETVSLEDLLGEAVLLAGLRAHGVEVEVAVAAAGVGEAVFDRQQILAILVNLAKNARQALKGAGVAAPRVRLEACADEEAGRLRLSVRDNGPGLPSELLERVFAPGFTTKTKGQGLGLHGSREVARRLGGDLRAESEGLGRGAVFVLELPLRARRRNSTATRPATAA